MNTRWDEFAEECGGYYPEGGGNWLAPNGMWIEDPGQDHRHIGYWVKHDKPWYHAIYDGGVTLHYAHGFLWIRTCGWLNTAQKHAMENWLESISPTSLRWEVWNKDEDNEVTEIDNPYDIPLFITDPIGYQCEQSASY